MRNLREKTVIGGSIVEPVRRNSDQQQMQLYVPINNDGEIDEENIAKILRNATYWNYLDEWASKNFNQQLCLPTSPDD